MNKSMHIHIAEAAVDWLTGDCAAFWQPLRETIAKASNYPDYFATGETHTQKNNQIDLDWREYNMVPNTGNAVVHSMITPLKLRETYFVIVNHWTAKVIENIKSNDNERAAKFAGCLSHIIGDTGQTAHVFDECILKNLFPQGNKRFVFHSTMENVNGKIETQKYEARALGDSLCELNWRLIEECEILKLRNTAEVIPLVEAVMNEDDAAAEASATRSATSCAKLFADLLSSLWRIAYGKDSGLENEFDLCAFVPARQSCDLLFNYEIMLDRLPGKTIDNPITLNLGNGDIHGIALLANMSPFFSKVRQAFVEYSIPASVFKYFEAEIGLNRNSVNETQAIFKVKLDGKTVFLSKALSMKDSAVKVKVKLGNARCLQLYVRDARIAPCDTKFFYPVFANPVLTERI